MFRLQSLREKPYPHPEIWSHDTMRRLLMILHIAPQFRRIILKLAPGRIKSLSDCDIEIFTRSVLYNNLLAGDRYIDVDIVLNCIQLLLFIPVRTSTVIRQRVMRGKKVSSSRHVSSIIFDGLAQFDISRCNLQRNLHWVTPFAVSESFISQSTTRERIAKKTPDKGIKENKLSTKRAEIPCCHSRNPFHFGRRNRRTFFRLGQEISHFSVWFIPAISEHILNPSPLKNATSPSLRFHPENRRLLEELSPSASVFIFITSSFVHWWHFEYTVGGINGYQSEADFIVRKSTRTM